MAKIFREEKQFPTKITTFAINKQQNKSQQKTTDGISSLKLHHLDSVYCFIFKRSGQLLSCSHSSFTKLKFKKHTFHSREFREFNKQQPNILQISVNKVIITIFYIPVFPLICCFPSSQGITITVNLKSQTSLN